MLQREHSAILLTFIKLPFVIKIFVLSIFEWLFYTGFTVVINGVKISVKSDQMAGTIRSGFTLFTLGYLSKILG